MNGIARHRDCQSELVQKGVKMADDESNEGETGSESEALRPVDGSHVIVDVVGHEVFLDALKDATPPNARRLTLIRKPPSFPE